MKKVIVTIMAMIFVISTAMSQPNKKYKEIKLHKRSETIQVSADKLWEIVGPGFENAGEWSTAIDQSSGYGEAQFEGATCSARSCDLNAKGFNKIKENLVLYDENKKELAYEVIEGNPGFVVNAKNHWKVIDLGNGTSALEMTLTIQAKRFMGTLMGGFLKKNINQLIPGVFYDLKIYAETGEISDKKRERMQKLRAKQKVAI